MHRYRFRLAASLGLAGLMALGGCALPSSRENVEAAAKLVASQSRGVLAWRRDATADAQARQQAESLLADGLTLDESVAVAFLASPELQISLEELEIARAALVAAATPPNPVAVVGTRRTGGDLAAFYPDRSVSIGVLQNVLALLNMPDRRAVAKHDLQRARYATANLAVTHAAQVVQAWLEYNAALQTQTLRERSVATARAAFDSIVVQAANGAISELDVALERNTLFGVEESAIRARLAMSTARARLAEKLGIGGWRDDWRIAAELPALPVADPDAATLESAALQRRLDLQGAAWAVKARLRTLATERRFRWLNQLEFGLFRDEAIGGTTFTGPNAVIEIPLFDQRQSRLLTTDAEYRMAQRQYEALQLTARTEVRTHVAEMAAARQLLDQIERDVRPNQRQIIASLGRSVDPGEPQRLHLRLSELASEESRVTLLKDYWVARSALALSAGDWNALSQLP